jgi:hypothetical protein
MPVVIDPGKVFDCLEVFRLTLNLLIIVLSGSRIILAGEKVLKGRIGTGQDKK